MHVLPLLADFIRRYPRIRPEVHLDTRQVDLVSEGYDAAIGGGFDLAPGLVSRTLAPAHIIAVAPPCYLQGRQMTTSPADLSAFDGIVLRVLSTGRVCRWTMRDGAGNTVSAPLQHSVIVNDPAAMRDAALHGLGGVLTAVPDVLPALSDGSLVRLLRDWYGDAGSIAVYYASRDLLPTKTRVFVDWVAEVFRTRQLSDRFWAANS